MPHPPRRFDPAAHPETRDLPIVPYLPRIASLLEEQGAAVLVAEPGAGKSTLVPLSFLDRPRIAGTILVLEPRRIAAAGIAARMSELLGEPVGRRVGYRVRAEVRVSGATRIEVITEALLTRRIQHDPGLSGVGLVIFDEFHERSIHTDLGITLLQQVRELRGDLPVLVMSATIEGDRVAEFLGGAPVIPVPGRTFPVETHHRPMPSGKRFEDAFADTLRGILAEAEGDVLAFLPGAGEIRKTAERLGTVDPAGGGTLRVLPLHGMLGLDAQRIVLRPDPDGFRRVILATSVAETSITVPGIRIVVDSGFARLNRYHLRTGMDRLVTERESRSSADQRRGRAGRTAPGTAFRLWDDRLTLEASTPPEILRSDLSGLVLECAVWGAVAPGDLSWLDPPPVHAWEQARELLLLLGAVDRSGGATPLGFRMADLGLPPRLAAIVLAGAAGGSAALAAVCAAVLDGRDESGIGDDADLRVRLEALRTGRTAKPAWRERVLREASRLLRRIDGGRNASSGRSGAAGGARAGRLDRSPSATASRPLPPWSAAEEEGTGSLLLAGYPDRLAMRIDHGTFRFPSGRQAGIRGPLAGEEWIVAPDADAGAVRGFIHLAAPLSPAEADAAAGRLAVTERILRWEGLSARNVTVRRIGRIVLEEHPGGRPDADTVALGFCDRVRSEGLGILPRDEETSRFLARCRYLDANRERCRVPDGFPGWSDEALLAGLEGWLAPFLSAGKGPVIDAAGHRRALVSRLGGGDRAALDREAPESIRLPGETKRRITWNSGEEPYLAIRIQDAFGLRETPLVCGRPLVIRLLSPAMRPLQITSDLPGFWRNTWPQVRKEMRGRYPKHRWPEDPTASAPPG